VRKILKIDKVLVPTDGSTYSLKAAEHAAEIAKKFGSEVQIMNVMGPGRTRPEDEKVSQEILNRTKEVFDRAGVKVIVREPVYGHPAETICDVAEKEKFDLIVMGSRGLSEIKAYFLGGVSDKVTHHAVCTVLIVR